MRIMHSSHVFIHTCTLAAILDLRVLHGVLIFCCCSGGEPQQIAEGVVATRSTGTCVQQRFQRCLDLWKWTRARRGGHSMSATKTVCPYMYIYIHLYVYTFFLCRAWSHMMLKAHNKSS